MKPYETGMLVFVCVVGGIGLLCGAGATAISLYEGDMYALIPLAALIFAVWAIWSMIIISVNFGKPRKCKDCKFWKRDYCRIANAVGPCPETKEYYKRKWHKIWRLK